MSFFFKPTKPKTPQELVKAIRTALRPLTQLLLQKLKP
ncbi:unnamed protein product [Rhodiola kirilowii]